jgi:hypothetical protein
MMNIFIYKTELSSQKKDIILKMVGKLDVLWNGYVVGDYLKGVINKNVGQANY